MQPQRRTEKGAEPGASGQMLTFRLGSEQYAIDVLGVQEIKVYSQITRVPNVPSFVKGVMNLRGTVIPVIDLRIKFDLPVPPYDRFTLIIVVSVEGKTVGLVVDAVNAVVAFPLEVLSPPPELPSRPEQTMVTGVAHVKDGLVMCLDVKALVEDAFGMPLGQGAQLDFQENRHVE